MEPFQVAEIISNVAGARANLSGLAAENIPPDRMARCEKCVRELEMAVSEVVSLP